MNSWERKEVKWLSYLRGWINPTLETYVSHGRCYTHSSSRPLVAFLEQMKRVQVNLCYLRPGSPLLPPVYFWMTYFAVGPIAPLIGNVTQIVLVFQVRWLNVPDNGEVVCYSASVSRYSCILRLVLSVIIMMVAPSDSSRTVQHPDTDV